MNRYLVEICTASGHEFDTRQISELDKESFTRDFFTRLTLSPGPAVHLPDLDGDWFAVRPECVVAITVEDAPAHKEA